MYVHTSSVEREVFLRADSLSNSSYKTSKRSIVSEYNSEWNRPDSLCPEAKEST
jgi:hypothetical protein